MHVNKAVQAAPTQAPAKQDLSPVERFTQAVYKQFAGIIGREVKLTEFQERLIKGYFIKLDAVLRANEIKRMKVKEQYRETLPYSWKTINLEQLSIDVVNYSGIGLDATQKNHINLVCYKNNKTNQYDVNFTIGYVGEGIKAMKYGVTDAIPDNVVVELVYASDIFKAVKKDRNNPVEGYTFNVTNEFERGPVVGGFYYHEYYNNPEKNKLEIYSKKDIDKRKPPKASAEFWGGDKDVWEDGKKVGVETIEGWYEEMAWKTMYRAAYSVIPIDAEKIDAHYTMVMSQQQSRFEEAIKQDIATNANQKEIGFDEPLTEAVVTTAEKAPATTEEKPEFE